ncbi:MAG: isoleucine--tRNA ligase [Tenericutes bacterium HGW-Tenericutes-1]|jgi:isoleucyl-tRNA synthetase|nr:MAG: isoleucine--tRNA ligase [Tenericutes bacterium HGW-Tenericutes-1]
MEVKNYKDTLLMPKTEFPMRGNLGQKEPLVQQTWEEMDLYSMVMQQNANKPFYVLHDGPPYANGSIHAGTALNKTLKDFVLRYKNMSGFKAPYIPGWDTHGLPIENALSKDRKVDRKSMPISEFRNLCAKYALEQVEVQKQQFRRLGVLGEWNKPYLTLDKTFEAAQIRLFGEMVEKGLIYKGLKPVYWSPSSESALAEAEIEYYDVVSPSIYVAMPIVDAKGVLPKNSELLIWTTTPWTIPANLAVALGPDIEYVLIKTDQNRLFVVAKSRLEAIKEILAFTKADVQKSFLGSDLEGVTYKHPLYDRISPVILGDHVTTEDGTGLVHTAPGHGEDDFIIGQKYHLDVFCPVDEHGKMMKSAGERFEGLFVDDCNGEVIKALEEVNALLKSVKITHSYPHDWRTKKPVIFRATPQWFASIDKLKTDIMNAIQTVKWYPNWGDIRLGNMIKDRGSWCISRQRAWGVPIPAFYTEKGTTILTKEVIDHVASIFAKEGSNAWFEKSAKELLPIGFTHPDSPNNIFTKETDIMDVWFDSGSSHHGAMIERGLPYPADLYLEGSDQYRGWFNSSLTTGIATMNQSPYKTLVSHGFITDGEGRKMSKSLGNVVDPNKIANTLGADIFRLWVSSVDYQSDVRLSDDLLNQVSETYRKIRNTFKFLLGNLFDFDFHNDLVAYDKMGDIDRYILRKLDHLIEEVTSAYEDFRFDDVYRKTANFVTFTSAFYLDFTKDILYIEKTDALNRRSIQTVFYMITDALLRLLTPLIPHTTSEAYSYLPNKDKADVYLLTMPTRINDSWDKESIYDDFMSLREDVLKALEEARNEKIIGKSLNAHLILYPRGKVLELLEKIDINLAQVFIVSKLETKKDSFGKYKGTDVSIDVLACEGITCQRCWQVVPHVHDDGLCDRCESIVE